MSATPSATWHAVRNLDLARSLSVRALFVARGFGIWSRITFDELLRQGFTLLAEEPGRELVLGVVGRFWRPSGPLETVTPDQFLEDHPGLAKAAWNFQVNEAPGGSSLTTETRVFCPDESTRRQFARYWNFISPFSAFIRMKALAIAREEAERTLS